LKRLDVLLERAVLAAQTVYGAAPGSDLYRGLYISQEEVRRFVDPHHVQPPLLAHYLKLDDQIVRLLLEQDSLDPRLAPFCQLIEPCPGIISVPR